MEFETTSVDGLILITPHLSVDDRGLFARTFSTDEFAKYGLRESFNQSALSYNPLKGTLRGLHYQVEPHLEVKLVRCARGAVYDVVLDLRPQSDTFKQWYSLVLTVENRKMLYVPEGCAHGFITLKDESEVFYQISGQYDPECTKVVRWNDPAFAITWPIEPSIMSERDQFSPFQSSEAIEK
jgi:dTDP-4-dehydrorhamnose 3,5-epimerase